MTMHQLVETPRQPRSVLQEWAPMDRDSWGHFAEIAKSMALASTIPDHLQVMNKDGTVNFERTAANCMQIVTKAAQWRIHPFDLAQASYVQRGRIGYEGKLIQALIERDVGNLDVEYEGSGDKLVATITGSRPGDGKVVSVIGTYADWASKTKEGNITHQWKGGDYSRKMMMRYRGAREWARAHHPGPLAQRSQRRRTRRDARGLPGQKRRGDPGRARDGRPAARAEDTAADMAEPGRRQTTFRSTSISPRRWTRSRPTLLPPRLTIWASRSMRGSSSSVGSSITMNSCPFMSGSSRRTSAEHTERMPKELLDKAREAFGQRKEYLMKRRDEPPNDRLPIRRRFMRRGSEPCPQGQDPGRAGANGSGLVRGHGGDPTLPPSRARVRRRVARPPKPADRARGPRSPPLRSGQSQTGLGSRRDRAGAHDEQGIPRLHEGPTTMSNRRKNGSNGAPQTPSAADRLVAAIAAVSDEDLRYYLARRYCLTLKLAQSQGPRNEDARDRRQGEGTDRARARGSAGDRS